MPSYRQEFSYLAGSFRRRAAWLLALLIFASGWDIVGICLVWPIVALLSDPASFDHNEIWREFRALWGSHEAAVTALGLCLLFVFYTKAFLQYRIQRGMLRFGARHFVHTSRRLLDLYQRAPYEFIIERSSAVIAQHLTNHSYVFSHRALVPALRVCSDLIVVVSISILLAVIDPGRTAILALLLGAALLLYDRRYRGRFRLAGERVAESQRGLWRAVRQALTPLKEIRVLGVQRFFFDRVFAGIESLAANIVEQGSIQILPRHSVESIMVTFIVISAITAVSTQGPTNTVLATLGVFGAAAARLIPSLNQIAANIGELRFSTDAVFALASELRRLESLATDADDRTGADEHPRFESLELRDVGFRYRGSTANALSAIRLTVARGQSIGIIGPSGAGKTTLVDVILGLLVPQEGEVLVNDRPLSEGMRPWRRLVAYLPQQVTLVEGTIRSNVAFGVPPESVQDDRVWSALEAARLRDHVEKLPDRLDAEVGEHGVRLSGGERQRVALARAFYFERDVFVLDEATSNLDSETEAQVVAEIARLKGVKTLIVIAHRLSTVRQCDVVYRLEAGSVTAEGSYELVVERASGGGNVARDASEGGAPSTATKV